MPIAIKAENISKAYQLGEIGTGTLSRDLERWISKIRGKEDPFLRIGETNDRSNKGKSDVVWSLKNINFEIEPGDTVGIIGRNGAGKSTLLKILSRITSPTTGRVTGKGRIASLLEVGTGFHPELTGRENIYLNGAILGMRRQEITRKFDEIIDFAGIERYVDTPVKRYSSGMYVRLAFAVAAHLESEILIVDEVLAVGDAEFQKKCLGKMGDISRGEGRTVLFVSHNIGSVKNLCNKGILLEEGHIILTDSISNIVNKYTTMQNQILENEIILKSKCGRFTLNKPRWLDEDGNTKTTFTTGEKLTLQFSFNFIERVPKINPGFAILDLHDQRIFTSHMIDNSDLVPPEYYEGKVTINTTIDVPFSANIYKLIFGVRDEFENTVLYNEDMLLEIHQTGFKNGSGGLLDYTSEWSFEKKDI